MGDGTAFQAVFAAGRPPGAREPSLPGIAPAVRAVVRTRSARP
ncbi:hypothetical protein ACFWBB_09170 [Streptomyces sp. NPDC060000]